VSKLVAIEELAGVDTLCADKTGTLTQNKLTLGDPFCVNNIPAAQLILDGALASRKDNNDTIDLAVLAGLKDDTALKTYKVTPFQAVRSRPQAHRSHRHGTGRKAVQSHEGRAAGDPGAVVRCRYGEVRG
jgi:H+-transporting ATPase